ncbi:MAG: alkaline phosphatase [Gammaproteobacteria bacterium]
MKNKLLTFIVVIIFLTGIYIVLNANDKTLIATAGRESPQKLVQNFTTGTPKKIIFLIGDGMGINHTTLGRFNFGGPDFNMAVDRMPIQGLVTNHSYESLGIDSAASATALATGTRTTNRFVGLDNKKNRVPNITELLGEQGYTSGLVATSSLTHATPAAYYAHVDSRYKEEQIANQLIASKVRVALGGGKNFFNLESTEGVKVIFDLDHYNFDEVSESRLVGLFAEDGIERGMGPSQLAMTKAALNFLEINSDCGKYFLMSEGSQIDWASHDNNVTAMLIELADFNDTVNFILDFASKRDDTLVVVSSDHETGGLSLLDQEDDYVLTRWTTDGHSLSQIAVYAYGPGAEEFSGKVDQTEIFSKLLSLSDQTSCSSN